ncbi:hypothetical protein WR25_07724 [Diploscapter pachys]|uniref:Transmembrane protein 245 n=1 Tax=Diploscapter pachys TaxID=2018661 RepID=A0A2A2KJ17_9BILA|nr:hypothetical protein WR25_07724 [Diploscapter pachys]
MAQTGENYLMNRFAGNNEQRTALQFAFYNTLLFVLLGICLCGVFALYKMLYMFLSPIMWAVLIGTVLFPFKRKVTQTMQDWLEHLKTSNTTLVLGLIKLPFSLFWDASEFVYNTAVSQTGVMIGAAYIALKILSYERTFMYLISWMGKLYGWADNFIVFFSKTWIFPLILLYFCAYGAWIYVQDRGSINKKLARTLSLPIWTYVLSYISMYAGPFRAAVFGASALILGLLSAGVLTVEKEDTNQEEGEVSIETSEIKEENSTMESIQNHLLDEAVTSDKLIRGVAALCGLLWVVRHDSALFLLLIPLFFQIFWKLGEHLGVHSILTGATTSFYDKFGPSIKKIVEVTVAGPLRQFVKILFTSDQMLVDSLHSRMGVLSSLVVMIILALSAIFGLVFIGVQLHGETVHLVRLGAGVISSHPDILGAALNYTEDQLENHDIIIEEYVQQAYEQGRTWLASNVRALADPKDTKRADMLEQQVKQIVDNLYRIWEERNNVVIEGSETSAVARGDWLQQLQTVTDLRALKEELTLIIKENLETIMNVARSIGAILAANVSFLSSIFAAFAGLILGFGMDILNLLIEIIVFLTMVYYLLSASHDRWLPLKWASDLASVTNAASSGPTTKSTRYDVTAAIEHAIFGVFVLSAKMSVFYGLYTYFVHSLFDLNIVFVPSMTAALFAAIPIMPPYIVCVCGSIELWLVRGEGAAALVFCLLSIAPIMFADGAFYREVKGSHPYVTGLAIIGGMYWLGLQGAIIGPIILCSFLVLVNVYLQFAKSEETQRSR